MTLILNYLQYYFLRALVWAVDHLSDTATIRLGDWLGWLLSMRKRRHQIATENVRIAFPEKSETEIQQIVIESFQSQMHLILEFIRIPVIAKNPDHYMEMQGGENIDRALAKGKGVIFAAAHFGNWELMGVAMAAHGWPMHAIGKPVKNPFIYEYIKKLRGATGLKSIDKIGAVRNVITQLKKNQAIGMLADEHVKKGEVWVDFLGRKASTSCLHAMFSLRYGTPVIPAFYYRAKTGRSIIRFGEPFEPIDTGHFHEDLTANTQRYVKHLEGEIRKRPGDWTLWMHNRWRKQEGL